MAGKVQLGGETLKVTILFTDIRSFTYGAGPYTPLAFGVWTDLILDLSTVTTPGYDPTQVVQLGVQFYSGDPPEAGAFAGPNTVVFHIDSITE